MSQLKAYIGTKIIQAEPERRLITGDEDKLVEIEGYRVVYPDGYESWSPKSTFEEAYRLVNPAEIDLIQRSVPTKKENDSHEA